MAGVGTELGRLIPDWAVKQKKGCGCSDMAKKMDKWGPDTCEKNINKIVTHLLSQSKRLIPALAKTPKPLQRAAALRMIKIAIHRSRGR